MLYRGDDWAEDHHDVELVDERGTRLARKRLPEGLDGVTRLHALIAEHMPPEWAGLEPGEAAAKVRIGIETERGPWVQALIAAGYRVYAINPMSVARYRQRHSTSGAKSDLLTEPLGITAAQSLDRHRGLGRIGDLRAVAVADRSIDLESTMTGTGHSA